MANQDKQNKAAKDKNQKDSVTVKEMREHLQETQAKRDANIKDLNDRLKKVEAKIKLLSTAADNVRKELEDIHKQQKKSNSLEEQGDLAQKALLLENQIRYFDSRISALENMDRATKDNIKNEKAASRQFYQTMDSRIDEVRPQGLLKVIAALKFLATPLIKLWEFVRDTFIEASISKKAIKDRIDREQRRLNIADAREAKPSDELLKEINHEIEKDSVPDIDKLRELAELCKEHHCSIAIGLDNRDDAMLIMKFVPSEDREGGKVVISKRTDHGETEITSLDSKTWKKDWKQDERINQITKALDGCSITKVPNDLLKAFMQELDDNIQKAMAEDKDKEEDKGTKDKGTKDKNTKDKDADKEQNPKDSKKKDREEQDKDSQRDDLENPDKADEDREANREQDESRDSENQEPDHQKSGSKEQDSQEQDHAENKDAKAPEPQVKEQPADAKAEKSGPEAKEPNAYTLSVRNDKGKFELNFATREDALNAKNLFVLMSGADRNQKLKRSLIIDVHESSAKGEISEFGADTRKVIVKAAKEDLDIPLNKESKKTVLTESYRVISYSLAPKRGFHPIENSARRKSQKIMDALKDEMTPQARELRTAKELATARVMTAAELTTEYPKGSEKRIEAEQNLIKAQNAQQQAKRAEQNYRIEFLQECVSSQKGSDRLEARAVDRISRMQKQEISDIQTYLSPRASSKQKNPNFVSTNISTLIQTNSIMAGKENITWDKVQKEYSMTDVIKNLPNIIKDEDGKLYVREDDQLSLLTKKDGEEWTFEEVGNPDFVRDFEHSYDRENDRIVLSETREEAQKTDDEPLTFEDEYEQQPSQAEPAHTQLESGEHSVNVPEEIIIEDDPQTHNSMTYEYKPPRNEAAMPEAVLVSDEMGENNTRIEPAEESEVDTNGLYTTEEVRDGGSMALAADQGIYEKMTTDYEAADYQRYDDIEPAEEDNEIDDAIH